MRVRYARTLDLNNLDANFSTALPMIQVIASPYYLGHHGVGMGAGPAALLDAGLVNALRASAQVAEATTLDVPDMPDHEIGATFAVLRQLAERVRAAKQTSTFPIVLGGNCNVCIAAMAALPAGRTGVVWFDAHGDFHSPDTTASGFFDGFPLHMLVGRSWTALTASVPGFTPVSESSVLLAGGRDVDPGEDALLAASAIVTYDHAAFARSGVGGFEAALDRVVASVDQVYVHVDLDVLDRELVPANPYSAPGGLAPAVLTEALRAIGRRIPVGAASLTCYSPESDPDGRAQVAAVGVITELAALAGSGRATV